MLAYNCVLIMSLLWLNCRMTTAFPVNLFGYGDPVISPSAVDDDGMMVEETMDDQCLEAEGFIRSPSGDQCFLRVDQAFSWTASEAYCRNNSLELARPLDHNVPWLAETMDEKDGLKAFWVGGRGGSGDVYTWRRDGEVLHNDSPMWLPGHPHYTSPDSSRCVALYAGSSYPDSLYWDWPCCYSRRILCERLMV